MLNAMWISKIQIQHHSAMQTVNNQMHIFCNKNPANESYKSFCMSVKWCCLLYKCYIKKKNLKLHTGEATWYDLCSEVKMGSAVNSFVTVVCYNF